MIERRQVVQAFESLLGRPPDDEAVVADLMAHPDLASALATLMQTPEYRRRFESGARSKRPLAEILGAADRRWRSRPNPYLAPPQLEVEDIGPRRMVLVGGCFMFGWPGRLDKMGYPIQTDRFLFAHAMQLPQTPPQPFDAYDLQLVQAPLGSVVPESEYARLPYDDPGSHEAFFESCVERLDLFMREGMKWSDDIPTFVPNYFSPQTNMMGRLLPRYDLRNPIHFVERLNMELDRIVSAYRNAYMVDTDHIASVCGRRYLQEDVLWPQFHGGFIDVAADLILDGRKRLERSPALRKTYDFAENEYIATAWLEIRAAFRILKGVDRVKMLCVDLDDTLWRGVAGELGPLQTGHKLEMLTGWPAGLIEALLFLKKRGIILAVISKNDEAKIRDLWDVIFEGKLRLDEFAIVKIDWRPKAETIAEAIAEANVLPNSVVFLDDNPVERASVTAAFPDVRAIATSHYEWRRVLGWSAELQLPAISSESSRRTELVQAQVARERTRAALSREDFLQSLGLTIAFDAVRHPSDARFARAFELVNKTNQFNTTGRRWSDGEATAYLTGGGVWWTFEVADKFTRYGLVGVVSIAGARIDQFVMSCRVAGLDVERAALAAILARCGAAGTTFESRLVETGSNAIVGNLFARLGWSPIEGAWRGGAPSAPSHVRLPDASSNLTSRDEAPPAGLAPLPDAPRRRFGLFTRR